MKVGLFRSQLVGGRRTICILASGVGWGELPNVLDETPPAVLRCHHSVVRVVLRTWRQRPLLSRQSLLSSAILTFVWSMLAANRASALDVQADLGWDGAVRLGRWNTAAANIELDSETSLSLECLARDSEGHWANFRGASQKLGAGSHRLTVPFQVGRPDAPIQLQIRHDDELVWKQAFRPFVENGYQPLVLSDRLVVTVGQPRGFDRVEKPCGRPSQDGIRVVALPAVSALPELPVCYEGVDWLVLAGREAPSSGALSAIRQWVYAGGRLFVSLPAKPEDWSKSPLREWLPIPIADETVVVRELGQLEFFAGRNLRIPYAGRREIPKLVPGSALVLASSLDDPLLARASWGLGEVIVLALDLTQAPLANWGALPDFVQRFIALDERTSDAESADKAESIGPLTSSGISDLASQLQASQDHFAKVQRPAPWWTMAWMLGLVALIGPLDYLIVHKLIRRPRWTWATLPCWLCGLAAYATSTSDTWNASAMQVNQTNVIDIDAAAAYARVKSWTTIYSPKTTRLDCRLDPAGKDWAALWSHTAEDSKLLGWFFVPETTTGGLYRAGGGEWGRTSYSVSPDGGGIDHLPALQWSSRTLAGGWSGTAQQLVDSNLRNAGLGRLSGDFVHFLPGTLTDWILAYGGRYYRLQASREDDRVVPLKSGVRLTTEDPLLLQGDLRSLLVRVVVSRENSGTRTTEQRIRQDQAPYDVQGRDPLRLWQVLSFHRKAGGRDYTGLSNDWLLNDDFSRQLDLDQAVLFGRLDVTSPAELKINGAIVTPDRSDVFVRIALPVRRSGEVIRVLPKLGNEDDRR